MVSHVRVALKRATTSNEREYCTIGGGRVPGLCAGDVLALLPHGSESETSWLAKARPSCVDAFDSRGDIVGT